MKPTPKDLRANLAYRAAILKRAAGDREFQKQVWIRCSRDPVWFISTFLWTYDPKTHPENPHQPFILYQYQEKTALELVTATGKRNKIAEKSRQMGFTWLLLAIRLWFFLFRPGLSFLLGSRKEDLVDSPGDPITLFYKLDYMLSRLPGWMLPSVVRTDAHLQNEDNGTVIDGESTNDNFGRGGTRTAIDVDEFSAVENGYAIMTAIGDATNSWVLFGTSQGASGAYYDTLQKMKEECPEDVIRWHWSEHPEKSLGLYTTDTGEPGGNLRIIDTEYWSAHDQSSYKFVLDGKLRSVAYDTRERTAPNKMVMAQEWDIDYLAASSQWFDQRLIDRLKKEAKEKFGAPKHVGEILLNNGDWKQPQWFGKKGGAIRLWFDWPDPEKPGLIPKEWNDIAAGADVAMGTAGEYSSNSVATFFRRSTGQKIAEFVTNSMEVREFLRHTLALCRWFNDAHLAWETNGPGAMFSAGVRDEGYRNVYMQDDSETKFAAKKTFKPGWTSTKDSKKILLADYQNALLDGAYKNPSIEALDECSQYIQRPNGVVEHVRSRDTIDAAAAGESHGDRVIGDALSWKAAQDLAKREISKPKEPEVAAPNTFKGRWERYKKGQANQPYRYGSFAR